MLGFFRKKIEVCMKKNYSMLVLAALASSLAACAPTSSTSSVTSSVPEVLQASDIQSAFSVLQKAQNYELSVELTKTNLGDTYYSLVDFTPKYIFGGTESVQSGYVLGSKGAYRITLSGTTLLPSEILSHDDGTAYDSIWGNGFFSSFADFDQAEFVAGETSHVVTNKLNKLAALKLAGLPVSDFVSLDSVTATMESSKLDTLKVDVKMAHKTYTISVLAAGTASNATVDKFLSDGGKELTISNDWLTARGYFKDNNYTRNVLSYDDNTTTFGEEYFLPTYFFGNYNTEGQKQGAFSEGLLGIKHKTYKGTDLYGSYLFYLSGTSLDTASVTLVTTGVYNQSPDVSSRYVYNYPSNLKLWSMLEFVKSKSENVYVTTNTTILDDFATNYQISSALTEAGLKPVRLETTFENIDDQGAAKVTFRFYYGDGAEENYATYPMYNFGTSNLKAVDKFIADNNLGD